MRYRGQQLPYDPERKVRTTEHVISDVSYNFLEWKVLQRGHCGFWLHTQGYADRNPGVMESDASTVTLRIPIRNKLDVRAIDRFRELSLDCVSRFQSGSEDHK